MSSAGATGRLGVECDVAVLLGGDLRPRGTPFTEADAAGAVAGCLPAIEVVQDRYVDYPSLDTGESLLAGDVVLLGSLVQPHWVEPPAHVEILHSRLGGATARFI